MSCRSCSSRITAAICPPLDWGGFPTAASSTSYTYPHAIPPLTCPAGAALDGVALLIVVRLVFVAHDVHSRCRRLWLAVVKSILQQLTSMSSSSLTSWPCLCLLASGELSAPCASASSASRMRDAGMSMELPAPVPGSTSPGAPTPPATTVCPPLLEMPPLVSSSSGMVPCCALSFLMA